MCLQKDKKGSPLANQNSASSSDFREFLCGWGAAFINITLTFPINKVMFRQMLHGVDSQSAISQLKREGLRYLYRGIFPPLLQKSASAALMFGMYDQCRRSLNRTMPGTPPLFTISAAAMVAGAAEAALTPFERIQTILQDRSHNQRFRNSWHAFRELRPLGLAEYYRGLTPILLRNGASNVLFFGLRGEVRQLLPIATTLPAAEVLADFVSGALLGALISTLFYPVNVVKTRMQTRIGGDFDSMSDIYRRIYEERGRDWRRVFHGVHVNYSRALLSWGIINASYELLKRFFYSEKVS